MSSVQNLSYSVIQVIHNFGALATVGGSIVATLVREDDFRRKLAHLALIGWVTQAASGATFGMVTYHYYSQFPDMSGLAMDALGIKMCCATLGILLLTTYLFQNHRWTDLDKNKAWITSTILSITAFSAAAFLRWFS